MMNLTKKNFAVLILSLGTAIPFLGSAQEKTIPESTATKPSIAQQASDDNRDKKYQDAYRKILTVTQDSIFSKKDILFIKTEALLHIDEKKGVELAKKTLAEHDNDEQFMSDVANVITQSKGLSKETYLYGVEILKQIAASMPEFESSYIIYDYTSRCLYNAGELAQAISYAEKSVADAKKNKASKVTLDYLEGVLAKYKGNKSK